MNHKKMRIVIVAFTAAIHVAVIFLVAFEMRSSQYEPTEAVREFMLFDLQEYIPPPPPPPPPPIRLTQPDVQVVEAIAETIIEVEEVPEEQIVVAYIPREQVVVTQAQEVFLRSTQLSTQPTFCRRAIGRDLTFPAAALRDEVEGRVMLELFVDRRGEVVRVRVLREEPEGYGFADAAVSVFNGRRGVPATVDGEPVAARFRYPLSFRITGEGRRGGGR